MKTLLQINLSVNCLSTGKIAEDIGRAAIKAGWKSYIAGTIIGKNPSQSKIIKIEGSNFLYFPYIEGTLLDNHCFGYSCQFATKKLIAQIEHIKPDIIQLHTLHAYYLNLKLLFEYFATIETPIVWTLHDCWAFTGHCAYFDTVGCDKWKTQCQKCPQLREYPKSLGIIDNSYTNYQLKKKLFTSIGNRLSFVPVSDWLSDLLHESFLQGSKSITIKNGIDLSKFRPTRGEYINRYKIGDKHVILGIASSWSERKGLHDFYKLNEVIDHNEFQIILVGLNKSQIKSLPDSIIGLSLTENIEQLSELYTRAVAFVNPTYQDTYPTVNLESMACGTPVIAYNTGGCPEAINLGVGTIIEKGNINAIKKAIEYYASLDKNVISKLCREKALEYFDKETCFKKYINLYTSLSEQNIKKCRNS